MPWSEEVLVSKADVEENRHHIIDLEETFAILRCFQMKLNPSKYAFDITFDKFLGFTILQREIKANPKKF